MEVALAVASSAKLATFSQQLAKATVGRVLAAGGRRKQEPLDARFVPPVNLPLGVQTLLVLRAFKGWSLRSLDAILVILAPWASTGSMLKRAHSVLLGSLVAGKG